jgi:hypothetical protein
MVAMKKCKGGTSKTVSKKVPTSSTRSKAKKPVPATKKSVQSKKKPAKQAITGKTRRIDETGIDEKINRMKSQMQALRRRDRYTVNEASARWRDLTQQGEDNFCPDTEHNGMARYYLEHSHYKFPRIKSTIHHKQLQPNLALYLLKTFAAADKCGLIKVYSIGVRGDEYYVSDQDYWLLVDRGVLDIE